MKPVGRPSIQAKMRLLSELEYFKILISKCNLGSIRASRLTFFRGPFD